jgi:glycosyltransferase involved in cell wall biosynthesis
MPVGSNITPVATTPRAARERLGLSDRLVVALFGRAHPGRALDYAEAAIAALAEARGTRGLTVLNLGADAPSLDVAPGVDVRTPGHLGADDVSLRLWASDVLLLPFTDGVSTRRTTLMAALAHGRPVLGLRGHNTDPILGNHPEALTLTPAGDRGEFARAAVALTGDAERLRETGAAGRRLYLEHFDWPVVARSIASALEDLHHA